MEVSANGHGNVIYPNSNQVTIYSGSVNKVSYTATYGLFGSPGLVALYFTNNDTGDFKSWDFICDNNYNQDTWKYISLPPGTYTITMANCTAKNFKNISINFN